MTGVDSKACRKRKQARVRAIHESGKLDDVSWNTVENLTAWGSSRFHEVNEKFGTARVNEIPETTKRRRSHEVLSLETLDEF